MKANVKQCDDLKFHDALSGVFQKYLIDHPRKVLSLYVYTRQDLCKRKNKGLLPSYKNGVLNARDVIEDIAKVMIDEIGKPEELFNNLYSIMKNKMDSFLPKDFDRSSLPDEFEVDDQDVEPQFVKTMDNRVAYLRELLSQFRQHCTISKTFG